MLEIPPRNCRFHASIFFTCSSKSVEFNIELRKKLKAEGFLSRDARGKERKKYGQKGARKRFQFSKR